jgi:hypothetical protein
MDPTLFVAVLALVVAIIGVWVAVWQVKRTLKEERKQALSEQRYDILLKIDALVHYYQQKGSGQTPTIPLVPTKREIVRLLARPTGMPQSEIEGLLSLLEATPPDYTKDAWELVQAELNRLLGLLNPSVIRAAESMGMK